MTELQSENHTFSFKKSSTNINNEMDNEDDKDSGEKKNTNKKKDDKKPSSVSLEIPSNKKQTDNSGKDVIDEGKDGAMTMNYKESYVNGSYANVKRQKNCGKAGDENVSKNNESSNWGYESQDPNAQENQGNNQIAQQSAPPTEQQQQQYGYPQGYCHPPRGNEPPWMSLPMSPFIQTLPPGLEYLAPLTKLTVKQRIELWEMFSGFEFQNKYDVYNDFGQRVYKATEKSGCCTRFCCGPKRTFEMEFIDPYNRHVMQFFRPYAQQCCDVLCLQYMTIQAPPGNLIGLVEQQPNCCRVLFHVKCPEDVHVATIYCPYPCQCYCFSDIPYEIHDTDGNEIGRITRKFTFKGYVTDADNFTIEFGLTLAPAIKACLLGALFLIDFMFFENVPRKPER